MRALPFGAPMAACESMTPELIAPGYGHGGEPQTGSPPYHLNYYELAGGVHTGRYRVLLYTLSSNTTVRLRKLYVSGESSPSM